MPMSELPHWAYTDSEWENILFHTVEIVDGTRMVYDKAAEARRKAEEQEAMRKQILIEEEPALGLIL